MNTEIKLDTYPSHKSEAVALAWLKQQDLSDKTPAETLQLFNKALREIKNETAKYFDSQRTSY